MLIEKLNNEQELSIIETRIESEVQEAVDFAEVGTWEPIENLTKFVYSQW